MNWLDIVILAIIAVSAIISLMRGFVREVISVLVWIGAFWLAYQFTPHVSNMLENMIGSPTARTVVAFAAIFVIVLLLGAVANYLLGKLVDQTGLSGTDRMIGLIFGVARGVLVVAVLVLVAGLTPIPREQWWRDSFMTGLLQPGVCYLGVDRWLSRINVRSPVGTGNVSASGTPAADYWEEFCGGMDAARAEPAPAPEASHSDSPSGGQ